MAGKQPGASKELDDATTMSKGCPILEEGGSVDVRQIHPMRDVTTATGHRAWGAALAKCI
jgi:hypothetical protein